MDLLFLDVRQAFRRLRHAPAFAAMAVLTVALAAAANTAVFSLVYGVLLRPLPFPEPERLTFITRDGDVSIPDGIDWRADSRTYEGIALFLRGWNFDLTGQEEPERLRGVVAEPDYFTVLGQAPLRGRVFTAEDDEPGGAHVALISEGLWHRRFGGAPDVVGRGLRLNGLPTEIIGVMPESFDYLHDGVDVWVPVAVATPWALAERGTNNFDAIGRLRAGVSITEARAELRAISERLEAAYPRTNRGKIVEPLPLLDFMVGGVRRMLWVLAGAVVFVTLIACANLASLMLARSSARRGELAVRLAVGGSRARLVRQILVEGLVLAALGGGVGLLVAWTASDVLAAVAPRTLPRLPEVAVRLPVALATLGISVACGLLFSLLPAWQVLRGDAASFLKDSRGAGLDRDRHRTLRTLVGIEVALACVLLVGAGLLGRTFLRLQEIPLGFSPERVLTASIVLSETRYASKDAQTQAMTRMVDELLAVPGVEKAAYVITAPLDTRGVGNRVLVDGQQVDPDSAPGARARPVVGDYFGLMRIPLVAGRTFTADDREGAPRVAVVNERLAQRLWPGESPIGKRIAWRDWMPRGEWMTVVGLVGDVRNSSLLEPDVPAVYTPYVQRDQPWQRFGVLAVRTAGDPRAFARSVQEAVWRVDPDVPLDRVEPLATRVSDSLSTNRTSAASIALFGAIAFLLALQGTYAVLAYVVQQQRREIAVRMALGARRDEILGMVLGRGLRVAAVGVVFGVAGAALVSRLLGSLLHGVAPLDVPTYAAVLLAVPATAALASFLPAARAARVDPARVLRED